MNANRDPVVLVHGLWMNQYAMRYLGRFLNRTGKPVHYFSYSSRETMETAMVELHRMIANLDAARINVVAHSLGGLLTLKMLHTLPDIRVKRVVLLGSPINENKAARALASVAIGRWMLGHSARLLSEGITDPPRGVEVGLIAGTKGMGLGRLVTQVPKPRDGAVGVIETQANWLADHIQLHVSHSGMLFSSRVAAHAACFLKTGKFRR